MNIWLQKKTDNVTSQAYLVQLKVSDGFLKPKESWRHCNGSEPRYRGYLCGFWTMFHTMTVHEFNVSMSHHNKVPHEVVPAMLNYSAHFLQCEECKDFLRLASARLDDELVRGNSSILWLWRVHNQMNYRLIDDEYQDPFFPKEQFPSKKQCSACFHSDTSYNEDSVQRFLRYFYSKQVLQSSANNIVKMEMVVMLFWVALVHLGNHHHRH